MIYQKTLNQQSEKCKPRMRKMSNIGSDQYLSYFQTMEFLHFLAQNSDGFSPSDKSSSAGTSALKKGGQRAQGHKGGP